MRCDDATLANAAKMVLGLIASNEESLTAKTACKLAEAIVEINSEQMHDVQERCVKVLGENEKECGEMRYGISLLRRYSAMKFLRTAEIRKKSTVSAIVV